VCLRGDRIAGPIRSQLSSTNLGTKIDPEDGKHSKGFPELDAFLAVLKVRDEASTPTAEIGDPDLGVTEGLATLPKKGTKVCD
jgi:hypothetical protein